MRNPRGVKGLRVLGLVALALILNPGAAQDPDEDNFACEDCVFEADGQTPRTIRAMFMDSNDITYNPTARSIYKLNGVYNGQCDDPVKANAACFVAENWNGGWLGETFSEIREKLGIKVVAMTRANFSTQSGQLYQGVSSYTRCCWEVKLGHVDMCVGDFWELPERRRLTAFTSATDLDTMKMVTLSAGTSKFQSKQFLDVFQPFKPEVWGCLVGFIFVAAVMLYIVETDHGSADFQYEDSLIGWSRWLQGVLKAFYYSCLSYVSAAPVNTPVTWAGRLLQVSLAFLLFVFVASYTANLAFFLIAVPEDVFLIESSSQLMGVGARPICMLESMATTVDMEAEVLFDDYGAMLWGMVESRKCDVAVVGKVEYLTYVKSSAASFSVCNDPADEKGHSSCVDSTIPSTLVQLPGGSDVNCEGDCEGKDQPSYCPEGCKHKKYFCDILTVPENFELTIPLAMPVNQSLASYMSAWIVKLRLEGDIAAFREKALDDKYPVICGNQDAKSDEASLAPEAMAGTFLISVCLMVIGLIVHLVQLHLYRDIVQEEDWGKVEEVQEVEDQAFAQNRKTRITQDKIVKKIAHQLDGLLSELKHLQARR